MALISLRQLLDHAAGHGASNQPIPLATMAERYEGRTLDPRVAMV